MSTGNQYAYTMANAHDEAPEVARPDFPEAVNPQQHQQYQQYQHSQAPYQQFPSNSQTPKPEDASHAGYSAHTGSHADPNSPHPYHATPAGAGGVKKPGATICGCTAIVFVLCAMVALLSAAVIGLAAGTGVEANRANNAETRVAQLSSSLTATGTSTAASATATSFADLDRNCSGDPDGVTGTTYDAFSLYGSYSFTIQCNKDATGDPLMGLFSSDFDTCMDHCASYNKYIPAHFPVSAAGNNTNTTCGGVSFIPLWTTKAGALKGGAPGNCYLKGNQTGELDTPNIGTECHAAVLNNGSSAAQ